MSAKRRAETIAKFCIPARDDHAVGEEPVEVSSRLRPLTRLQPPPMELDGDEDNVSDFAPNDCQSDNKYSESDSDEELQAKRRKCKGKEKVKEKAPAKSRILKALREFDGESNPRVMLISLKGIPFVDDSSVMFMIVSQPEL